MSVTIIDLREARRRRRAQAQSRNSNGEFHSGRSLQEKLRIIRAVAEAATRLFPDKCPNSLSVHQVRWDAARSLLEPEFGRIPRACELARQVRAELGDPRLSWRGILELAHCAFRPQRKPRNLPGQDEPPAPSIAAIAFALVIVARFLSKTSAMSPQKYDEGKRRLLRQRKRTPTGDDYLRRTLPSSHTIIAVMGSWPNALALAGLESASTTKRQRSGLPVADAIAFHYAETGRRPSGRTELERFAKAQGFSLQSMTGKAWSHWDALGCERIAKHPELPPPVE